MAGRSDELTSDAAGSGAGRLEPAGLTTPRAAGVAGLVFAALFTSAILLLRPSVSLGTDLLAAAISGSLRTSAAIVTSYLVPFSGIAFLWFIGVVRDLIGIREDKFFATVFLGSGILFVAMLFGAAAVIGALLALDQPSPAIVGFGRSLSRSMLYVFGSRAAGVFTLVASTIVLRTGATVRWMAFLGFVIGLVLLLAVASFDLVILLFPAWVALLSMLILVRVHERKVATG